MNGYDEDVDVSTNQAMALFEIAAALRQIAHCLSYNGGDGQSISEALQVGLKDVADANEAIASRIEDVGGALAK